MFSHMVMTILMIMALNCNIPIGNKNESINTESITQAEKIKQQPVKEAKNKNKSKNEEIEGLLNFNIERSENNENFLLFDMHDPRFENSNKSIVKEINKDGELVNEYVINDSIARRLNIHQKPTDFNNLYITFHGPPVIDNYFYMYSLKERKFKKVELDYFDHIVGVSDIEHYGEDIIFDTIYSHISGSQRKEGSDGTVSTLSNLTTKQNFETIPNDNADGPKLFLNDIILYTSSGNILGAKILAIDTKTGERKTLVSSEENMHVPLFSDENYAYFIENFTNLMIIDKDLNIKTIPLIDENKYYFNNTFKYISLDKNKLLVGLYNTKNDKERLAIVKLDGVNSKIEILDQPYLKDKNARYTGYYNNMIENEIYILKEVFDENRENVLTTILVVNNSTFQLIHEIKVQDPEYLWNIDFIIRN